MFRKLFSLIFPTIFEENLCGNSSMTIIPAVEILKMMKDFL